MADVKKLAEELVNLKVTEVNDSLRLLEGRSMAVEPAAAVCSPLHASRVAGATGRRAAARRRTPDVRRDSVETARPARRVPNVRLRGFTTETGSVGTDVRPVPGSVSAFGSDRTKRSVVTVRYGYRPVPGNGVPG